MDCNFALLIVHCRDVLIVGHHCLRMLQFVSLRTAHHCTDSEPSYRPMCTFEGIGIRGSLYVADVERASIWSGSGDDALYVFGEGFGHLYGLIWTRHGVAVVMVHAFCGARLKLLFRKKNISSNFKSIHHRYVRMHGMSDGWVR